MSDWMSDEWLAVSWNGNGASQALCETGLGRVPLETLNFAATGGPLFHFGARERAE